MSLNPDKRTSEKDVLTQYGYACKQLGIDLQTSSVSQAKGLIERTNDTFQSRLVNELKLQGITTIDEANQYLLQTFVPYFNNKFVWIIISSPLFLNRPLVRKQLTIL